MDKQEIIDNAKREFAVRNNRIHSPMSAWHGEHVVAYAWWPERGDVSWYSENRSAIEHYQVDKYTRRAFRVKAWLEVRQTTDGHVTTLWMTDAEQKRRAAVLDEIYAEQAQD